MVGAARFELATSCTPSKRASQATLRPDRNPRATSSAVSLLQPRLTGTIGRYALHRKGQTVAQPAAPMQGATCGEQAEGRISVSEHRIRGKLLGNFPARRSQAEREQMKPPAAPPHEPRSSRRKEASSEFPENDQSLLTSAATLRGFNARNYIWEKSLPACHYPHPSRWNPNGILVQSPGVRV
jgi:hypothetical protein